MRRGSSEAEAVAEAGWLMPCSVETRYGRFRVRHPSLLPRVLRYVRGLDAVVERRDCGTGSGGFKPGNTCGKGEGGGGADSGGGGGSSGGSDGSASSDFPTTHHEASIRMKEHFDTLIDKNRKLVGIQNDGTEVTSDHPFSAEAKAHIQSASEFMTPTAMQRVVSNVQQVRLYKSPEELTRLAQRAGRDIPDGYEIAGQYASAAKELRVSQSDDAKGTVSHELMHAVDGPGFELSSSAAWKSAYEREIHGGRLSRYAQTSAKEGFAEFGRAVVTRQLPLKELRSEFPECWAAMKSLGVF